MIWILITTGGILFLIAAVIFCVAPGKMTPEAEKTMQIFKGLNCAHRGLHTEDQQVPENSITAFLAAREGNYGVELDVQLTKDDKVIVFHDIDLKRACGVDALVKDTDWKELSTLSLFDTQEHIPLLADAIEALGDTPVIVELKYTGADKKKLCSETLKILKSHGKQWCMESFDPRICSWFRKNAPDVLRGQLSCPPWEVIGLSKISKIILGNLLINFMSRPHFVAYSNTLRPLIVRLCLSMKPKRMIWPVRPDHDIALCEKENDTIIFEYYKPKPRYR